MLPFLDVAKKQGIPVLVMNPNFNYNPETMKYIPYNRTMTDHARFVWKRYVKESGFDQINVVAHSAGGGCLKAIMNTFNDTFWKQVDKIAYTDSWVINRRELDRDQRLYMRSNAVHYLASTLPAGTPIREGTCPIVSAGHHKHEYTTGSA